MDFDLMRKAFMVFRWSMLACFCESSVVMLQNSESKYFEWSEEEREVGLRVELNFEYFERRSDESPGDCLRFRC